MEFLTFLSDNVLQLLMMLIGFGLLVLEIYLPGFGVAGISGSVLMVLGIILAADSVVQGLVIALVVIVLLGIAFTIAMRAGAKGKILNKKLVLEAVATDSRKENPLDYYVGLEGTALTPLSPVGSAEIEGVRLSVLSEDGYIPSGEKVKVIRAEGKQLYVEKVS
ncbi:MAG: serine protease [Clostridia bacterium]|nr:serine protease [Clostridia bacterium]MBQ2433544.1 serine protease [Clostridia bacterium]